MAEAEEIILTTPSRLKTLLIESVSIALKYYQPPAAPADEVLTIKQASEFLNLTTQTIYGLVSSRKIPFSKPTGSRLYFSRLELIEWLKTSRTATVQEQAHLYEQTRSVRQQRAGERKNA